MWLCITVSSISFLTFINAAVSMQESLGIYYYYQVLLQLTQLVNRKENPLKMSLGLFWGDLNKFNMI